MRSSFPYSFRFFIASGIVYALQLIPVTGVFLMFLAAMFWSVALVNLGMIGTAFEALWGSVSRWWLALPLAFYGGYWAVVAQEQTTLRSLSASYEAANALVVTGFDPARNALVLKDGETGSWLTQHYALPVAYSVNSSFPEGHLSHRMVENEVCAKVRGAPAFRAAFVHASSIRDGEGITARRQDSRFCSVSMPEQPELPMVHVSTQEQKVFEGWLPVTRITTTITMPANRQFQLLGGHAAPLSWVPLPMMGCGLNSRAPSWDCFVGFRRDEFTPIVSGDPQYRRDSVVLARALGLTPVAIADRQGGDPTLVLAKAVVVEDTTLARQLANIDARIADPAAKVDDWRVDVLLNHRDVLASRTDAIMVGVERAARMARDHRYRGRESGRILARLLAGLPRDRFVGFGPRLLALYEQADKDHWLWEVESLVTRLGDLGTDALPYLVNPRVINVGGIEGLCRVGPAGRAVAEPALVARWNKSRDGFDRDARVAMFVAMRRIGITPPPLPEDKRGQLARLEAEWADISPRSPPRVCAVYFEQRARREDRSRARSLTGSN